MPSIPKFEVVVLPDAEEDLRAIALYIAQDSPANAHRLLVDLLEAIHDLAIMPSRFPPAREAGQMLDDPRQRVEKSYRIIYEIRGRRVEVLGVRHAARGPKKL